MALKLLAIGSLCATTTFWKAKAEYYPRGKSWTCLISQQKHLLGMPWQMSLKKPQTTPNNPVEQGMTLRGKVIESEHCFNVTKSPLSELFATWAPLHTCTVPRAALPDAPGGAASCGTSSYSYLWWRSHTRDIWRDNNKWTNLTIHCWHCSKLKSMRMQRYLQRLQLRTNNIYRSPSNDCPAVVGQWESFAAQKSLHLSASITRHTDYVSSWNLSRAPLLMWVSITKYKGGEDAGDWVQPYKGTMWP